MYCTWFSSNFLRCSKFFQIKKGWTNFLGEPFLQNGWIIWSLLLYFSFKKLFYLSLDIDAFYMIQEDFYQIFKISSHQRTGTQFLAGTNSAKRQNIQAPNFLFHFKRFFELSFFVIRYILIHYKWFGSTFPRILKFLKIKSGRPNLFWRPNTAEWFNYLFPLWCCN